MSNREYVTMLEKYKKAVAGAGADLIAASDKAKLGKLIDNTLITLKIYGESDKYTTIHNALYAEFDKLAKKTDQYNSTVKKRNSYLEAAIKDAKLAKTLAAQQKALDKAKDLKSLPNDMVNVADWLDIARRKEISVSLTEP